MLDHLLRARHHWDRHEIKQAIDYLNLILNGGEPGRAFYWTAKEQKYQAGLPFEIAVMNLLVADGALHIDFDVAFARLWNALPLQYLVLSLAQRKPDRERNAPIIDLLLQAAGVGLLSTRPEDYDLSGKVVLDPEAYPELVEFIGGATAVEAIERAMAEGAWSRVIAPNADLIIDLFLYAVFHQEPSALRHMILVRLYRIADSHGLFLEAFSRHLAARLLDPSCHDVLVSIGLRIEHAPSASACLEQFMDALTSRDFEPFAVRYYPDPDAGEPHGQRSTP